MANKTILSVAISCILWGSMSSTVFASVTVDETTVADDGSVTTTQPTGTTQPPPPTGTTQPPPPTGTTQPPPQPTGTTQPPPPTGTTQPPPQPTGTTQPPPPTGTTQPATQPTGTTQPPPPTGTTQPPVQPTGTTEQPKPPVQPTGTTEQPKPPVQPTGTTEQPKPPVQPTGTTEQPKPPVQPTGTTEQPKPPVQPTGTTEQPKPPVQPTGTTEQPKPPVQPTGTTEQPKPPVQPTGTTEQPKPPVQPTGTTEQPKPPVQPTGTTEQPKPPVQPTGTTEQPKPPKPPKPNKPNFTDYGADDEDVTKFDAEKLQKMPPQAFGAFDKHNIKQVDPEAMTQVTSEQVGQLSTEAVDALKPEQVNKMPANAMVGLTAKQVGSLPPVVLQKLPADHFKHIDVKVILSLDGKDLSKMLVNLDATKIKPADVKDRLPKGWKIDDKGHIKAPAGTTLSLPSKPALPTDNTVKVDAPTDVPDLNKTFSLGGQTDGSGTVLDGLNTCLKTAGYPNFKMKQEDSGTLKVEGTGDAQGTELTFTPESDSMKQVAEDVPTGLTQDETGHFVLTTPDKQQVTVIPTPKDTKQVAESLGAAGSLKMDKRGVVTLEIRQNDQSPKQVRPVVFDPMITKAPAGKKAGMYVEGNVGEIVYADGTAQKMMPTVPVPDKFVAKAQKIPGVEKIQHNADGTFTVMYKGMKLKLMPMQFDAQTTPVAEGQTVEPDIAVQADGTVKYTTQDEVGTDQLEVTLAITE
jgi:hypothetical protein